MVFKLYPASKSPGKLIKTKSTESTGLTKRKDNLHSDKSLGDVVAAGPRLTLRTAGLPKRLE